MLWAQDYAMENRRLMLDASLRLMKRWLGRTFKKVQVINCHHNFSQLERHFGRDLWITRKGAIQADSGRLGIIPGSMGTSTFVVEGLGNADSYESCSHGAGRRFSRTAARKKFNAADLTKAMEGVTSWQAKDARDLVDEIPQAYKDIHAVMADQTDLVKVKAELKQIANYKGVDPKSRKKRK
jgi:tRNA-splicing ligase RtcB